MTIGAVFFSVCAVVCLAGALATILSRSPIRSAMGLLATIGGIAGLFLSLHAQFLAAIQIIVYAGAVVILFVFVIMLLGPSPAEAHVVTEARARFAPLAGAASFLLLVIVAFALLAGVEAEPTQYSPAPPELGSIEQVGRLLFTDGIVAFELTTALLIVAVVGAIAVARSGPSKRRQVVEKSATKRLFKGPVHPRDAARPLAKEAS